jgi:photosystem II stability/assembly factor-like uncharacterized protein
MINTNFGLDPFNLSNIGTQNLNVIRFLGTQTACCAGSGGIFMKSTDGGNSWQSSIIDTTLTLYDLTFPTGYIGYLSAQRGNAGVMMKTYDGGGHWMKVFEHYNFLGRMSFPDENTGYVTGPWTPAIFRTTDGGTTWTENTNWQEVVHDVVFETPLKGLVLLRPGDLYTTVDGGLTWTGPAKVEAAERLYKTGPGYFAVGNGGTIEFSKTGSGSWTRQSEGLNNNLSQIYFPDASHGIILGDSILLRTSNGGKKWSYEKTGITYIYAGDFGTENSGVALHSHSIFYTSNGGKNWAKPEDLPYLMHTFDIAYADNNRVFLSAINYGHFFVDAFFYRSDNGGKNFYQVTPFEGNIIYDLFFLRSGSGYAIGGNGAFFTSSDKGDSWKKGFIAERFQGIRVFFSDRNNGMVCGYYVTINGRENPQIHRTSDGGDTWELVYEDTLVDAPKIQSVYMTDKNNAYAIAYGTLLETHDGGDSWSVGYKTGNLSAIGGNSEVFAVGSYGTFITTSAETRISNDSDWIPDDTLRLKPWPNPFTRDLHVDFTLDFNETVEITLWNYAGAMVLQKRVSGTTGKNEITLDGSSIPSGVYLLAIVGNTIKSANKVMKIEVD